MLAPAIVNRAAATNGETEVVVITPSLFNITECDGRQGLKANMGVPFFL